jgi:hypothetical protein
MKKNRIPITAFTVVAIALLTDCSTANAQTFSEWFRQKKTATKYKIQQIAALQAYLGYVKNGYKICDQGLHTLSDIKNGTFSLDKDYFNSLKNVNPVVRNSPLVNKILVYRKFINQALANLAVECRSDENFSSDENSFVTSVASQMKTRCDATVNAMTVITTSGASEMQDSERLTQLDSLHLLMQDRYKFTAGFVNDARLLSRDRAKEKTEISTARRLYNITP